MRETTALKALQLVKMYLDLNEAARSNHMLIYLAEAALYMVAKFDESSLSVSFLDFHASVYELQSLGSLLHKADVKYEEIRWEADMYLMLEKSLLQTLHWQVDVVTPIDYLVVLLAIRARLQIDENRKPKFFSSASFGSKNSSDEEELAEYENFSCVEKIASVLPYSLILSIYSLTRKY